MGGNVEIQIEYIRNRITELRIERNISEYQMSYALGHSKGYINNISSGKSLPSMREFLAICELFGITPMDFFDEGTRYPQQLYELIEKIKSLNMADLRLLCAIADRMIAI